MTGQLIEKIHQMGYEATWGEAWRPQVTADYYRSVGRGISNSLHMKRLAVDINLFKDGRLLSDTEAHRPIGLVWEAMGGTWGGHFGDGNHYSLEHEGVK